MIYSGQSPRHVPFSRNIISGTKGPVQKLCGGCRVRQSSGHYYGVDRLDGAPDGRGPGGLGDGRLGIRLRRPVPGRDLPFSGKDVPALYIGYIWVSWLCVGAISGYTHGGGRGGGSRAGIKWLSSATPQSKHPFENNGWGMMAFVSGRW